MSSQSHHASAKTLDNMPPDIWGSALRVCPSLAGRSYRLAEALATSLLGFVIWSSRLVLLVWLIMVFASAPAAHVWRIFGSVYLIGVFLAAVAYRHFFELKGCVPRKDPEYPLITIHTRMPAWLSRYEEALPLSWICFAYAGLLWLQWSQDWQAVPSSWHTLGFAALNTATALAAWWYGHCPPFHGVRHPTDEEFAAYSNRRWQEETARENAAQAVQAPAPQPEYATPVEARVPRLKFASIQGMTALKHQMLVAGAAILQQRTADEPPRNGILLHGEPGNGKTVFAEALAGELGVPIVTLTYGDVSSKWLGEMPRLLSNCFAYARQHAPCVLLIDEVDSFIRNRDGALHAEDVKVANTILTEVVALREHQVVLVAATNYLAALDPAAIREGRFDFKVEVTAPDQEARIGLLREGMRRHLPNVTVDDTALVAIARRWPGFSVSRLMAITKAVGDHLTAREGSRVGFDDWLAALRRVQGSKGQVPASTKRLQDLYLEAGTREALASIAHRLRDVHRVESMGGTLPGGVLFYGPPGTGKTVAAQALALESGWAFLPVAGPDLLTDREALAKLYRRACDLRPALIFIDEADDILRQRAMSATPDVVNRLLALMDGSGARIPDVVFLAATNHPDDVDPALLRAGRFTEKICFHAPSDDQVARAVQAWLQAKHVELHGLSVRDVVELLSGRTMADVNGAMQYALNRAITGWTGVQRPAIQLRDIEAAARTVLAATEHARERQR